MYMCVCEWGQCTCVWMSGVSVHVCVDEWGQCTCVSKGLVWSSVGVDIRFLATMKTDW